MTYIVDPNTHIKYSIFSKNGIKLLKSYVKFYQTGGSTPELTKRTCPLCEEGYKGTSKLKDSNDNKCQSAQTTFDSCMACARSKMGTKMGTKKYEKQEIQEIHKLLDKAQEMKTYMKDNCEEPDTSEDVPAIPNVEEGGVTKDDDSLTSERCETGWNIKTGNIGEISQFANVYDTCCEEDCTYASKIIGNKMTHAEIQKEIEIHKAIYERDKSLTIPILDVFETPDKIILVLPKLRMTVGRYLEDMLEDMLLESESDIPNFLEEYVNKLYNILGKLHVAGFQHGDAHLNNFMINSNDEIKLIDFGKSQRLSQEEQKKEEQKNKDYTDLYESLQKVIVYTTINEPNDNKMNKLMGIINSKFGKKITV